MNNKIKAFVVIAIITGIGAGAVLYTNNKSHTKSMDTMAGNSKTDNVQPKSSNASVESSNQITYKGFAVVQKAIKVKKGTTVTWTNMDNAKHDVTPVKETDEFKASELFGKGETHTVTFNTVGTYAYFCSPHPYMKGTIEVTE